MYLWFCKGRYVIARKTKSLFSRMISWLILLTKADLYLNMLAKVYFSLVHASWFCFSFHQLANVISKVKDLGRMSANEHISRA